MNSGVFRDLATREGGEKCLRKIECVFKTHTRVDENKKTA